MTLLFMVWASGAVAWGGSLIALGLVTVWAFERRRPRLGEAVGLLGLALLHGALWPLSLPATLAGVAWRAVRRPA